MQKGPKIDHSHTVSKTKNSSRLQAGLKIGIDDKWDLKQLTMIRRTKNNALMTSRTKDRLCLQVSLKVAQDDKQDQRWLTMML